MTFELIATVLLTLGAAIAVAALATGFGATPARRVGFATGLGVWFALVVALAASETFHYTHAIGVRGLGAAVVLPIVVLAILGLRNRSLKQALDAVPLSLLIGVNVVRVLGVLFVLLYVDGRLPAPFAPLAGWGDIITGIAAAPVAWLAQRHGAKREPSF